MAYVGGVLYHHGNYKGHGDTKIIPLVSAKKLDALMNQCKFTHPKARQNWEEMKNKMYSLSKREQQFGLGDKV